MTVPAGLAQPLSWVGMSWPEGDATRLAALGDGWLACASALRERCANCDGAASAVWKGNRGDDIDSFRRWWTAPGGPSTNLARAAEACALAGRALKAQAAAVDHLKLAYAGSLNAMVRSLAQGGFLVGDGNGGMAIRVTAGDAPTVDRIRQQTRDTMREVLRDTLKTTDEETGKLLEEAKKKVPPAERPRRDRRRTEPRRRPKGSLLRELLELLKQMLDDLDEPRRYCPDPQLPARPWEGRGKPNLDTYPREGHVLQIDRTTLPSGARVFEVVGQVADPQRDPVTGEIVRMGWERDITQAAEGMWIPGSDLPGYPEEYRGRQGYHGSHLWGPVLGTEVREAIPLAPARANLTIQKRIEEELQGLHQRVSAEGGYVFVQARAETYPPEAWTQGHPMVPSGHNLVRSVDYQVFVCTPDGLFAHHGQYGYDVSLPTGSRITENFRAGEVTAVRWPHPNPAAR